MAWIRYRDAPRAGAGSIDVDCNYRLNRARTESLRNRLRACKAVTCRDDIARKSWN